MYVIRYINTHGSHAQVSASAYTSTVVSCGRGDGDHFRGAEPNDCLWIVPGTLEDEENLQRERKTDEAHA